MRQHRLRISGRGACCPSCHPKAANEVRVVLGASYTEADHSEGAVLLPGSPRLPRRQTE